MNLKYKRTNETIFATLRAVVLLVFAMEIFALLMSVFIFFAIKVTAIPALRIIIVCGTATIIIAGLFYACAWIACALPNMTMRNEGMFKSINRSMVMVKEKQLKVFACFIIPIVISYIPLILLSAFDIAYDHVILTIFKYFFVFLFYIFSFSYYIILLYVVFFDVNEIEREDLNMLNKWRI